MAKFKVGDRVIRDETNLDINWSSHKILHGKIIRVYSEANIYNAGWYPELYDVKWDNNDQEYNRGYLPHGLQKE